MGAFNRPFVICYIEPYRFTQKTLRNIWSKVFNEFNCFDTASILINQLKSHAWMQAPDKTIIEGGTAQLDRNDDRARR